MSRRLFPIQTASSCRTKWSWSTVWLNNGRTGSCCIASISDIGQDFDNFHNTEKKIKSRELMLQGQWPKDGCESCELIEQSGGFSDRQFQNSIPDVYPQELNNNPTAVHVEPVVLEVYFSNTCNLKCIYCNSNFSSAIQAEDAKFGGAIIPQNTLGYQDNRYRDLVPKFWKWFETHAQKLHRLQVAGGEPFLQKDVKALIEHFKINSCPDLEFNIITNLGVDSDIVQSQLTDLRMHLIEKRLKRVDIQASIDCWGAEQVYVRNGLDLDTFDTNMKNMLNLGGLRVGLLSTVNALSIPAMPVLLDKWKSWNQIKTVHLYMHLVMPNNGIFSPLIFRYELFKDSLTHMIDNLPNATWNHQATRNTLLGIALRLEKECVNNVEQQRNLYQYLEQNDQRRNLDWKKTFPWLLEELEQNHVV